jgi:hypothetical protein
MKKYVSPIIILILSGAVLLMSFRKTETKYKYCLINVSPKGMGATKVKIVVDYGQSLNTDNRLKNEGDEVAKFNSSIDALNYMVSQGWEYVQALGNADYLYASFILKKQE